MCIIKVISNSLKEQFELELNKFISNWDYENIEFRFSTAWSDDSGFTFSCMVIIKDCR